MKLSWARATLLLLGCLLLSAATDKPAPMKKRGEKSRRHKIHTNSAQSKAANSIVLPLPNKNGESFAIPTTTYSDSIFGQFFSGGIPPTIVGVAEKMFGPLSEKLGFAFEERQLGFVPAGRSLVKNFTSFEVNNERRILALGDQLFIGQSEKSGILEVISWNQKEGRYDFLLVENFGPGKKPVVHVPPRGLCLSCHQSGGPILSHGPWKELATNPYDLRTPAAAKIREIYGSPEKFNEVNRGLLKAIKMGDPNPNENDPDGNPTAASDMDFFARRANRRLQNAKACRSLCTDKACRELLLRGALAPSKEITRELQALLEPKWPADNLAYPTSVIPDRDPLTNEATRMKNFTPEERQAAIRRFEARKNYENYLIRLSLEAGEEKDDIEMASAEEVFAGDPSEEFIATEGSIADPLTERKKVGGIPKNLAGKFLLEAGCLNLSPTDVKALGKLSEKQIEKILDDEGVRNALEPWPPKRSELMTSLFTALKMKVPGEYKENSAGIDWMKDFTEEDCKNYYEDDSNLGGVVGMGDDPNFLVLSSDPLKKFRGYCGACHDSGPYQLPLNDLKALRDFVSYNSYFGDNISTILQRKDMPRKKAGVPELSLEERDVLIRALSGQRQGEFGR